MNQFTFPNLRKTTVAKYFILVCMMMTVMHFDLQAKTNSSGKKVLAADDAGITAIILPPTSLCGTATVQVTIFNYGSNNIGSVKVDWTVTPGGPQIPNTFSLNISPGTPVTLTIGSFSFSSPGTNYKITASTSLPNGIADSDASNDTTTLNVTSGLSGSYNVGTGGNYTTLTSAINTLNSAGVCTPVTFLLTDTSYTIAETFPIRINTIIGSSSVNTVTIKPASGKTVVIQGDPGTYSVTNRALIEMRGCTYFTFDGSNAPNGKTKDLTICNSSGQGTDDIATIMLKWGASYNTIKNCIVKGGAQAFYSQGVINIGDTIPTFSNGYSAIRNNFNSILNNDITNGSFLAPSYGINLSTPQFSVNNPQVGNIISGNRIMNFNSAGVYISFDNSDWAVLNNEIFQEPGFSSNYEISGILENAAYDDPAVINYRIMGNFIHDLRSSYFTSTVNGAVIGISSMGDSPGGNSLIANNTIIFKDTCRTSYRGIYDPSSVYSLNLNVAFNSVYIGGSYTGTANGRSGMSAAFWREGSATTTTSTLTLKNNILVNVRTGGQFPGANNLYSTPAANYAIVDQKETPFLLKSDYNDIYFGSGFNNKFGWKRLTGYTDYWDQWNTATGADSNSIHVGAVGTQNGRLPAFRDLANNDLHLDLDSNCFLESAGTPAFGVVKDMDSLTTGDIRDVFSPDIGADEFVSSFVPPFVTLKNDTLSTTSTATFYQWYRNGIAIPGATGPLYITTLSGAYYLQITNFSGCTAFSSIVVVNGINEFANSSLSIYPNPAGNNLWIKTRGELAKNIQLVIYNVIGEMVINEELELPSQPLQLDVSHLANGIYSIRIIDEGIIYNSKFIKN